MLWHTAPDACGELSLAEMTIRAGCGSEPHRHPNCEEMVFVRVGAVSVVLDGVGHALEAGDSLRIPRGVVHYVAGGGADGSLVLVWSTTQREYEPVTPGD